MVKDGATREVFPINNEAVPSLKGYYLSSTFSCTKQFQSKIIY